MMDNPAMADMIRSQQKTVIDGMFAPLYRKFDFKGTEPVFNTNRDDDEYRYSLAAQHAFGPGWLNNWVLIANWLFTDNRSSIAIFDFERHEVNFGLSRSF